MHSHTLVHCTQVGLEFVESALQSIDGVIASVIKPVLDTETHQPIALCAYLVSKSGALSSAFMESARAELSLKVPEYAIPMYWVPIPVLPMLSAGKVDRGALPEPTSEHRISTAAMQKYTEPTTAEEAALCRLWEELLSVERVGIDDDWFALGGHSLLSMRMMTVIRSEYFEYMSLRDLMEAPTVRNLAVRLHELLESTAVQSSVPYMTQPPADVEQGATEREAETEMHDGGPALHWLLCWFLQVTGTCVILMSLLLALQPAYWLKVAVAQRFGELAALLTLPIVLATLPVSTFAMVLLLKAVVVGRMRSGRYRLWSRQFLEWWFLSRLLTAFSPFLEPFQGTSIMVIVYRCLGARIGDGTVLNSAAILVPDLLSVDNGAHIGFEAELRCHSFEKGGVFVLGSVHIGAGAKLGPKAMTQPWCMIGDRASVGPLSALDAGQVVTGTWGGAPAKCSCDVFDGSHADLSSGPPCGVPCMLGVGISLYLGLLPYACSFAVFSVEIQHSWCLAVLKVVGGLWCGSITAILTVIAAKWILVGRLQPGTQVLSRWRLMAHWVVDRLMLGSPFRTAMLELGGSPIPAAILRILGAKVGRRSALLDVTVGADVDLLEIGDDVWTGSAVVLAGRTLVEASSRGGCNDADRSALLDKSTQCLQMQHVRVGSGSLLAEQVMVVGSEVAENQICGSITLIDRNFEPNSIIMGSPPGVLGSNHTDYKENRMTSWVQAGLTAIEVLLPSLFVLAIALAMDLCEWTGAGPSWWQAPASTVHEADLGWKGMAGEAATTAARSALLVALVYLLVLSLVFGMHKLMLTLFEFNSGSHKLYGTRVLIWDLVGQMQSVSFNVFGLFIRGTPLMRVYLRALGANIGARVFWDTFPPIETTALDIGDDVVVEDGAMLLGHVVDHQRLQFGSVSVGKGAVISSHVNVQPHTNIGSNVTVGCLTTVMKHETLPDDTEWVGSPAVRRSVASKLQPKLTAVHSRPTTYAVVSQSRWHRYSTKTNAMCAP